MLRKKNALPPQKADEKLSRELLLRYMAARAAKAPVVSILRPVSPEERELPTDEFQEPFVS